MSTLDAAGAEPSSKTSPGDGERRALGGYVPQLKVAAAHILQAFEQGTLEAIAVADPQAGRIDDLQLVTLRSNGAQVDAFQVKWSSNVKPLADSELRGLIVDAIKGRAALTKAWATGRDGVPPARRIVVHLHTNRPLSTAYLRGESVTGRKLTLQQLMTDVWRPAAHGAMADLDDVPEKWRPYISKLAREADTTVADVLDATADVLIEHDRTLPQDVDDGQAVPSSLRDIDAIVHGLLNAVTDRRKLVVIKTEHLLKIVGGDFAARWRPRSAHNFPVPPDFQPIDETEHALDRALSEFSQGYVFLTGTPGAGKSTLLTQRLTGDPRVAARYYAFVPGNDTPTRSEAHSLLHDLLLTLDRRQGRRTLAPPVDQLPLLRERFRAQLAELGKQATAAASVAIIVIDGLDHVLRDPAPERPLLRELLPATEVPEGVLFVLGTRNTEDLPADLRTEAQLAGRHVRMAAMTRAATLTLADHAGLEHAVAERVWQVSGGHPLLVRTFTRLATHQRTEDALSVLRDVPALDGEAMRYYTSVWSDLEHDIELVGLLGLVSRLRGPIDLDWLQQTGSSASSIEHLGRLGHLFSGSEKRWRFFHDSFREFLRHQTSLRFGVPDDEKQRAMHAELARRCAATKPDQPQAWEGPHHLLRSGDPAATLALATPEFFRAQMMALRPPGDVILDVREAAAALADAHDGVAVVRLTIAAAECSARAYHQTVDEEFLTVLIDLGYEDAAFARLRHVSENAADNDRTTVAMHLVVALHDRDRPDDARRILNEYEPIHALANRTGRRANAGGSPSHLYTWARAAVLVHGAEYVADQASKINVSDASWPLSRGFEDRTQQVRHHMLRAAAQCAADRCPSDRLTVLFDAIPDVRLRDETRAATFLSCAQRERLTGDLEAAAALLDRALDQIAPVALTEQSTIEAAELLYRLDRHDEARRWFDTLPPIALPASRSNDQHGREWTLLLKRLRLLAALDGLPEPRSVFPDSSRPYEQVRVVVARHVVALANLWGRSLRGETVIAAEIAAAVRGVLSFWDGHRGDRVGLGSAEGGRTMIIDAAIALASVSGRAVLREHWAWWEERWALADSSRSGGLRVIRTFAQSGIGPVSIRNRLRAYVTEFENDSEVDPSIWVGIARAWIDAKDLDSARQALTRSVAGTLNVNFRKDYQLSTWIRMLRPLLQSPSGPSLSAWLIDRIVQLDEQAEAGAASDAAHELLKVVGDVRSRNVRPLSLKLLEHEVFDVDDVLCATLEAHATSADETWWTVVAELLVPIGTQPIGFDRACEATPSRASLVKRLRAVAERVAVEGRPSDRLRWRRALVAVAGRFGLESTELGIAPTDLTVGDETPSSTSSRSDDVPAIPTLDDLRSRAQNCDGEDFVGYAAALATAELDDGDQDAAWEWASQALQRSSGRDWARWAAGGPALSAARVLQATDSSRATPLIFARYASAASTDDYVLGSPVEDLDRTIEAFGSFDLEAAARVVLEYVAALFDVPSPDLAAERTTANSQKTSDLAELVTWLLSKEHLLAWRSAQRTLLQLLRTGGDTAAETLCRAMLDDRVPHRRILDVLDVVLGEPDGSAPARSTVVTWLSERASGSRLDERDTAAKLLLSLGEPVPQPPARDLPAGLRISVPRAPRVLPGASDIGSTDVDEMLGLANVQIERLADAASLDVASLAERIRARAAAIASTFVRDRDLHQRTTVLGWGYVRPSATALLAAQNQVAAELVDCGRVTSNTALAISAALPKSYPDLLARRPVRRPSCVPAASPLAERTLMRRPSAWLEGLDHAAERVATDHENWSVIGELTELTLLGRANLRELRAQALVPPTARRLFTQVDNQLRDVLNAPALRGDASLIMRSAHAGLAYSDGFVGLHPAAALAAQLEPDPDDPLAWTLNGKAAVRTTWWRSGFAQWPPYYEQDEVGDGWLVLASPVAVSALLTAFPGAEVAWEVQRRAREEDSGDQLGDSTATGTRSIGPEAE